MANHDPIATADRWLASVLLNDAELAEVAPGGLFEDLADAGTVSPFLVATIYDAVPFRTFKHEAMWTVLVQVATTAVGENATNQSLAPAVSRIYELLTGAPQGPILGGGEFHECTRTGQQPTFTAGNARKRESTGSYKVLLSF